MKLLICGLLAAAPSGLLFGQGNTSQNARSVAGKKHILSLGAQRYYAHDYSKAMYVMEKLGDQSGLFDVMFRTDFQLVTKQTIKDYVNAKNLNWFDAVILYTQGDFPLTNEQRRDFMSFVQDDGKGLLVAHS